MSWSVYALGKPEAVAKKLNDDFSKITYLVPQEASVKEAVAEVIVKALGSQTGIVEVTASGSISMSKDSTNHSLNVSIQTKGQFLE